MLITNKGKAKNTQELISASVQILIEALESGHSEVLTQYLKAMARFHHYSFGNTMLIAAQKRDASHVAGRYAWNLARPQGQVRRERHHDSRSHAGQEAERHGCAQ